MRSFERMKKSSPGTPPLNGVGILFSLTYRSIDSGTSFLERPKAHFSIHLRHSAIIPLHGRGEQLLDPTFGFYPSQSLHMVKLCSFRY